MHTTGQVSSAFGKSDLTIVRWVDEFKEFMSPDAQPGKGNARLFTDSDVEVLAKIAELRQQKKTSSEIHAALKRGDRGEAPTGREITVITNGQVTRELATAKQRIQQLEEELSEMHERAIRAEGQKDLLLNMLRDKEAEIDRLKRDHG